VSDEVHSFLPAAAEPEDAAGEGYWFVFRERKLLVTAGNELAETRGPEPFGLAPVRTQYLGRLRDRHCYSAELAESCEPPDGMSFKPLQALYKKVPDTLFALAGRAVQIVDWDRNHQHCGACGQPTTVAPQERARVCEPCGLQHFPRLAPAIIVAVEREDEILLARSPHFPPGILSILAGFVEPGESLEEAVRREVAEAGWTASRSRRRTGTGPGKCRAPSRATSVSLNG
jgi:NAD+ diphosphatase